MAERKMTDREMFEKSFERPKNFFYLSKEKQWEIDKKLGILGWEGDNITAEDLERFRKYYD